MVDCVGHQVVRHRDNKLGLRSSELSHPLHIQHYDWSETLIAFVNVQKAVVEQLLAKLVR